MEKMIETLRERCPHESVENMDYQTWLEKRREGIGGSDAGAVMGMNAFASPLTVYLDKKGLGIWRGESKAMKRGSLLEPLIREATKEAFPKLEIATVPYSFTDPEFAFMKANIDGAIFAAEPVEVNGETIVGLGGHEIKSSKTGYGWGDSEIPDSYYCQVQHYARVLGLPWFLVSVYILDGEEVRHYIVRRNDDFIHNRLIPEEKNFWENYIVPGVMPAALGIENEDEMITGMFNGIDEIVRLSGAEENLCEEYVEINARIKELESRKKTIAINMKESIINAVCSASGEKKVSALAGPYSVSWSFYNRTSVDSDALKKAGLYEQYSKTSEVDRFTISRKKGA